MYKYKIVLNGSGGYYFSSLIKEEIVNYWLNNKNLELLEEYILAQYMQDEDIDDAWRIPEEYRFDIFNNIKSICLWETDSIECNNDTICDIYKLHAHKQNLIEFDKESDFTKLELIKSFLWSNEVLFQKSENTENSLIKDLLIKKNYESAYIIYFKTQARGYATLEEILELEDPININHLKFKTGVFGENEFKSNVIKRAIYRANTKNEKVLYNFHMLESARENLDYHFIGLQKVVTNEKKLLFKRIRN